MIRPVFDLHKFFEEIYVPARLARRSPSTREQFQLTIARVEEYAGRPVEIGEICDEMIDGFKAWRTGVSAPTVNKDLRNIRALTNHAAKPKYKGKFRCDRLDIEFEEERTEEPEAWSAEEVAAILASCKQEPGEICGVPARHWWPAQQLTIINTGARISAVMLSRTENLDLESGSLVLPGKTQKTGKGQKDLLHETCVKAIRKIYDPSRALLFDWPFDRQVKQWPALNKAYRRILARAGLPTTEKDLFHKLRRTNATMITAASSIERARDQLRHSSTSVTRRYVDKTKINHPSAKELLPWDQWQDRDERQGRLF